MEAKLPSKSQVKRRKKADKKKKEEKNIHKDKLSLISQENTSHGLYIALYLGKEERAIEILEKHPNFAMLNLNEEFFKEYMDEAVIGSSVLIGIAENSEVNDEIEEQVVELNFFAAAVLNGCSEKIYAKLKDKLSEKEIAYKLNYCVKLKSEKTLSLLIFAATYANRLENITFNNVAIKFALDNGANPNATDEKHYPLLRLLYDMKNYPGLTYILEEKADPDVVVFDEDKESYTLLHLSVIQNNLEVVKLLLNYNADPNKTDNEGNTALHLALMLPYKINLEIISLLCEQPSINLSFKNKDGRTPFKNYLWNINKLLTRTDQNFGQYKKEDCYINLIVCKLLMQKGAVLPYDLYDLTLSANPKITRDVLKKMRDKFIPQISSNNSILKNDEPIGNSFCKP